MAGLCGFRALAGRDEILHYAVLEADLYAGKLSDGIYRRGLQVRSKSSTPAESVQIQDPILLFFFSCQLASDSAFSYLKQSIHVCSADQG
jgi:hypothetical protein